MTTAKLRKIGADDIHNFHVAAVKDRLFRDYPAIIVAAIAEAHHRHHGKGTDAKHEADLINSALDIY